jgi:hypothetical protein
MNNMVVLDSKQHFVLLYKEICAYDYFVNRIRIRIILKKIRIEMESINIDARLVNFMLAFSGLRPLLVGSKFNFIQTNVTYKTAKNVRNF